MASIVTGSDPGRVRVAIALGSNLGDRRQHLEYAAEALSRDLIGLTISTFIETEPVGVAPGQPRYLNAAAVGATALSPRELLDRLLVIEKQRGRERAAPRAARTLDLDLILYGSQTINEEGLAVPHPRFRERAFVLAPLAQIAPALVDPVTRKTVKELLEGLVGQVG
jgi:2-amino-4-hydroxy-6-hydroxymethyldihydropteridine diphosphokinase